METKCLQLAGNQRAHDVREPPDGREEITSDVALGPNKMMTKKEPSDVALHGPEGRFTGTLPEAFR